MARVIIATSNNLVFDNRVHKVSISLINMGFEVWQTGRNRPHVSDAPHRPGKTKLFKLPVNKGPLFYFFLNVYTFIFLLFHKFNILWAVDMETLLACRIAAFLKNRPVVFDSHEFFSEVPELQHRKPVKKIWQTLEKLFIPGCHLKFTVSPGLVSLYKKRYDVDFDLLRNVPLSQPFKKPQIHPSGIPTILYQGALNTGRGIAETIYAMKYLPHYRFIIIGRGDCTESLKTLTKQLGLQTQVEFIGAVPFEYFWKYQENALVGMCLLENNGLNYFHSLPNRIFDYMQAGIPVITTDFPDISEIVKTYNTGLLIHEMDPQKIAESIQMACERIDLRKEWSHTIPTAAQSLTWENESVILKKVTSLLNPQA